MSKHRYNIQILLNGLDLSRLRFRYMCCIPAFIVVIIQISLVLALGILALLNGKNG